MDEFAARLIDQARHRGGLTQAELAALAGTSQPAIAAYESGLRQPTAATLLRIIRAAGFEPEVSLEPAPSPETTRERASALEQLLDLADHLPHRHTPRLPRRGFAALR